LQPGYEIFRTFERKIIDLYMRRAQRPKCNSGWQIDPQTELVWGANGWKNDAPNIWWKRKTLTHTTHAHTIVQRSICNMLAHL